MKMIQITKKNDEDRKQNVTDEDNLISSRNPYHPISLPMESPRVAKTADFKDNNSIYFFQLPSFFPFCTPKPKGEEPKVVLKKEPGTKEELPPLPEEDFQNTLEFAPEGQFGTLKFYKSGKIKLQVGEYLYDVQEATQPSFYQNISYIPKDEDNIHFFGGPKKRYICTPDIDSLLHPKIEIKEEVKEPTNQ